MNLVWSAKQNEAIELLATGKFKQVQVADMIGVDQSLISVWKRDPDFIESIIKRSRQLLRDNLPDIYAVTNKEASTGSYQHIKILLEHIEKLERLNDSNDKVITLKWAEPKGVIDGSGILI